MWVSLRDTVKSNPVVMVTEGHSANRNYESGPAYLLDANKVIDEHRYFSVSAPDTLDRQYLTVEQAAADHHKIIKVLKPFFTGKRITTGVGKGDRPPFTIVLFPLLMLMCLYRMLLP